jgi:DNA-binding CsgD family transcriptional regulator/tetratricopeptide (TPR) repeat protein
MSFFNTLKNNFLPLFALLFAGCLPLFQACSPAAPAPPDTGGRAAMDTLLARADGLPGADLFAQAQKLPGTWADSFFQGRLTVLHARQNAAGMRQTIGQYERLRSGEAPVRATGDYFRGVLCQFEGKYDSAEVWYARASDWFGRSGDQARLIAVLTSRSGNFNVRGKFDESISMKYQIMDLEKARGNEGGQHEAAAMLANALNLRGDYDKVLSIIAPTRAYFERKKDTMMFAYALGVEGNAMMGKKDYAQAAALHRQVLALRRRLGVKPLIQESLYNLGRSTGLGGDWATALDTLRLAEQMSLSSPNKQGLTFIQAAVGEALFRTGRTQEAEIYLKKGLELSTQRKHWNAAAIAADMLYQTRKQQSNTAESLQYLEQYLSLKDSVFSQEKEKIIQEVTAKYETREKEAQIVALHREKRLADERNWWIGGFLLLLAALGLFFLRYRHRKRQAILEKENEALAARQAVQQVELDAARRESEQHRAQLEDFTDHLMEKNRQIERFQSQLSQMENDPAMPSPSQDAEAENLDRLYSQAILTDADWERFKAYFERVYPGFLAKAKHLYPNLSPAELRMTLLLKMGSEGREIAEILGVSSDTVKKTRYRLRKKLNIEEGKLEAWVLQI